MNSRLLLSCGRCCFSCGSGVIPPRSRKGVASTATFGKVVVAVAIAITIAVIAVVMNTFFILISNEHIYKIYKRVYSEESSFIKKLT